jgi:4-nitrophenyl phosphatase
MEGFDNYFFDWDGVLFEGEHPLPFAGETIAALRRAGKRIYFLTNASGFSRQGVADKLERCGVEAHVEEVFVASYAAALHAKEQGFKKIFVVGLPGTFEEMEAQGIETIRSS